jgi:hypothetical protein
MYLTLTPCSKALLEKLIFAQKFKLFLMVCGTRTFLPFSQEKVTLFKMQSANSVTVYSIHVDVYLRIYSTV